MSAGREGDSLDEPVKPNADEGRKAWAAYWPRWRAWCRQQAEGSREGAMQHAKPGDPDGLLLRRLTHEELELLRARGRTLADELEQRGDDAAAIYVRLTLVATTLNRIVDLQDMEYNTRADIEANGHLTAVSHDDVAGKQDGRPWSWVCSCDISPTPYFETRDGALADGGEHIAQHGGRWDDVGPHRG